MEPSVFVAFVINLMPLEPVPVWTPFDCCLIQLKKSNVITHDQNNCPALSKKIARLKKQSGSNREPRSDKRRLFSSLCSTHALLHTRHSSVHAAGRRTQIMSGRGAGIEDLDDVDVVLPALQSDTTRKFDASRIGGVLHIFHLR